MWLFALHAALAGGPDVWPSLEGAGIRQAFTAQASAKGEVGLSLQLACKGFAEGLELCLLVGDDGARRYMTLADMVEWDSNFDEMLSFAMPRCEAPLKRGGLTVVQVPDMEASYRVRQVGDGCDRAMMLWPDKIEAALGPRARVAIPAKGSLVAWPEGSLQVDTVLAVGVRRIYEAAAHQVSPVAYTWNGESWRVWGEARPAPE